ncbi:3-hydroxyisobutyrate dehydrogenase-like beta-hydroxyacid dehydrogenase [Paraburkholderia unamae]|uniref:NAD(P)-binding domain-containing protein n=1 Tax=Paraburkholderia unamae TaxID=219649 RepID=UPI000DC29E58|nr:NAD(P)-binding domain-containing protein [Paraburkholderia unamae]RAR54523.1 3-hydroxyisobutyrate dehydrogenase-like beta-hydroxyacid dehydrogenase [Paraburkholderia unamae]
MKHVKHVVWLGNAASDPLKERLSQHLQGRAKLTPGGLAHDADAVITACDNYVELRELVLGPGGLFSEKRAGLLYVDISCISEDLSAEIAKAAEAAGAMYLCAPLTRGPATNDTPVYTAMVSGKPEVYEAARFLLEGLAAKITVFGENEEARAMTRVLDVMTGVSLGMWAEALVFGEAVGLSWSETVQVMETSAIASPLIKQHAARVVQHDYESALTCETLTERLGAVLAHGRSTGVVLTLTGIAHQMYLGTVASGAGEHGATAVIPWLGMAAGIRAEDWKQA